MIDFMKLQANLRHLSDDLCVGSKKILVKPRLRGGNRSRARMICGYDGVGRICVVLFPCGVCIPATTGLLWLDFFRVKSLPGIDILAPITHISFDTAHLMRSRLLDQVSIRCLVSFV